MRRLFFYSHDLLPILKIYENQVGDSLQPNTKTVLCEMLNFGRFTRTDGHLDFLFFYFK